MKRLFEEYGNFIIVILGGILILSIFSSNLIEMNKKEIMKMLKYNEAVKINENND